MSNLPSFRLELKALADPERAIHVQRFFKTGKGEYAEGDKMLGISVPAQRALAKKYKELSLQDTAQLLKSQWHEERLSALLILVYQFQKGDEAKQKDIFDLYLRNTRYINNWDLVDASSEFIAGPYLENKDKDLLVQLAHSPVLWERRIAMMATFCYIKKGNPEWALKIAEILKEDPHDLVQKAVGWMLREVGKRCSLEVEEAFLEKHYRKMPRTMLRYAIERFEESERLKWLKSY